MLGTSSGCIIGKIAMVDILYIHSQHPCMGQQKTLLFLSALPQRVGGFPIFPWIWGYGQCHGCSHNNNTFTRSGVSLLPTGLFPGNKKLLTCLTMGNPEEVSQWLDRELQFTTLTLNWYALMTAIIFYSVVISPWLDMALLCRVKRLYSGEMRWRSLALFEGSLCDKGNGFLCGKARCHGWQPEHVSQHHLFLECGHLGF